MSNGTVTASGAMIVALCITGLGCRTQQDRAPNSEQRPRFDPGLMNDLEDVRRLCPPGTTAKAAQNLLKDRCRIVRYYGIVVRLDKSEGEVGRADDEHWALEHETANGTLLLWLEWMSTADRSNLDHAIVTGVGRRSTVIVFPEQLPRSGR